jgi:hypothetical protein
MLELDVVASRSPLTSQILMLPLDALQAQAGVRGFRTFNPRFARNLDREAHSAVAIRSRAHGPQAHQAGIPGRVDAQLLYNLLARRGFCSSHLHGIAVPADYFDRAVEAFHVQPAALGQLEVVGEILPVAV